MCHTDDINQKLQTRPDFWVSNFETEFRIFGISLGRAFGTSPYHLTVEPPHPPGSYATPVSTRRFSFVTV